MKTDKSEKERQELHKKIIQVEQKEDEFMALKRQYETSLGNFAMDFQYLTAKMENLLYEHPQSPAALSRELAEAQSLNQQARNYVEEQIDNLEKVSRRTRKNLEEEREKLIKERNSLPWE
ncbi:hypothetical protein SGODD07_01672 [Streptococcus gordonii]|uniref:Cingulin n=1 Tax=Streptococcus gordonii TaxID=1302 RepID=A0A139N1Z0_STRGN|nr:hypothetical protein SGODD07_01672 [Streptococcus gordonii]